MSLSLGIILRNNDHLSGISLPVSSSANMAEFISTFSHLAHTFSKPGWNQGKKSKPHL